MTISYPLSLPSNNLQSIMFSLTSFVSQTVSPFTGQRQVTNFGGQVWRLEFSPPPMKRADAEEWFAMLSALTGQYGTFLAGDPAGRTPRGTATGTALVKGAGQTGKTLIIDGLTISTTGARKKGDWFQLGTGTSSRLYKLTLDADTNGAGETTLDFVPALRSSPADNASVTFTDAKGCFALVDNTVSYSVDSDQMYRLTFSATEAI